MKKLLFVFTALLLFSCSSSSDDNNNSSNSDFHPPAWIQGTWKDDTSFGYKFTSDNVCLLVSINQNCFKEMINNYNASIPNSSSVNESIKSDTEYKFSYTVQGTTQYFHFKKITNTKIEFVNPTQGLPNIPYIKQ